ncbi:GNAT family N-acetyltransferase [Acinetobacter sp. S40]|uniref:GNAT family N-acetyltransferase n=1 Tax=unclassified Acinetobacter TaxID=196816 RepID=UPI00190DBAE3|nr:MULTISPECIES: GNAT family N-acetyltransferase [unclassified Acinetobacter]MBJ9985095.1 GNAT family N-acetyltransferase [Acinetobacter sp. S40]MBK0063418.1 GNAT family N-acetyltransferase [Acinetobacter sp. S55]MBK0066670.1 GNAT family N-acetyltransferase [Acinetobacter sp. S54]
MYSIRQIQAQDNSDIARIIREVSKEYGLATDAGFAVSDPILDQLSKVYNQPNSQYWVIVDQNQNVLGGGGISPLLGDATLLEIQKMYFLPVLRGKGFAKRLLQQCFDFAKAQNFTACYLETTATLKEAIGLYEQLGFQHLTQPRGQTGHSHACEIWMLKTL